MVTQKMISLRLDLDLLDKLNREASLGLATRNWHINQAIRVYLKLLECRRLCRSVKDKKEVINKWLCDENTEAVD